MWGKWGACTGEGERKRDVEKHTAKVDNRRTRYGMEVV